METEQTLTTAKKAELAEALEQLAKLKRENLLSRYKPYGPQKDFHAAGAEHRERILFGGNQTGKSFAACMETAIHLTGLYPHWWKGKRFGRPVRGWAVGLTAISTRDTVQRLLLGSPERGTGCLPAATIDKVDMSRGLPGTVDTIMVKHASGGLSRIAFKSAEQGREKFQGETLDLVVLDEEPGIDVAIECLARLTARKGILYGAMTPLLGFSQFVMRAIDDKSALVHCTFMTLDDALHFTDEERARIESAYPEQEREARTRGRPHMGSGLVYQVAEEVLRAEPFSIPRHWARIVGVDFGWQYTAACWLAHDRDNDVVYVTDAELFHKEVPAVIASAIKARGAAVPVSWPTDGLQTSKDTGKALKSVYEIEHGLEMLQEAATFETGGRSVEAGIQMLADRMRSARFKVFTNVEPFWKEYRLYHRDPQGKIKKGNDHVLDACRYAAMMLRHAETSDEQRGQWKPLPRQTNQQLGIV